ncbi:MAG: hypothetical protein KKD46_07625 [Euryarchaeota archaeon]|jgi:hypothetical protein|nr:hypothetical protein [Euryarchaeota archaeon]MBU4340768.1 hypothetical protein [Euryarchaeota archaeon]MCG2737183.1 hypothetical protein [Candidatus Methanoperedenaceae archaeon]
MITEDEINKLVIARISSMPENMKISIGNYGTFDKYQLIENVKKRDEIGKKVVEIQLFYLRSMKGMLK